MRNKKGAAIIAWVLLMGFSIGLATTVFLWMTKQTETMGESATRFVEGGMQCDNVMINVANTEPADCNPPHESTCCLKIMNTRYLNIEKVLLRGLEVVESYECPDKLEVKGSIFCGPEEDWAPQNVSIMPIVKVGNDLAACKNKAITIEC